MHMVTHTYTLGPGQSPSIVVPCPAGERATGGGFSMPNVTFGAYPEVITLSNLPRFAVGTDVPIGWVVRLGNNSTAAVDLTVHAICTP